MHTGKLVYDSGFFRWLLRCFSRIVLGVGRWTLVGEVPKDAKFVAIAAPHTSNWDFPLFMAVVGQKDMRVRFLGKDTLFEGPMGWLFYWLGGIPVRRGTKSASNLVQSSVDAFNQFDRLILGIAPEGTRSSVEKWKTGFYRIAIEANVPILLAFVDSNSREIGLGPLFQPTGDMEKDMQEIQEFYADKSGVKPSNQ